MSDIRDLTALLDKLVQRRLDLVMQYSRDPGMISKEDVACLSNVQGAIGAVEGALGTCYAFNELAHLRQVGDLNGRHPSPAKAERNWNAASSPQRREPEIRHFDEVMLSLEAAIKCGDWDAIRGIAIQLDFEAGTPAQREVAYRLMNASDMGAVIRASSGIYEAFIKERSGAGR